MTKDGLVRAMLGGRDFKNGSHKFNRAVQALGSQVLLLNHLYMQRH